MKKRLILFAFVCAALTTCENQQVIAILKDASELEYLDIRASADGVELIGGATLSPGFRPAVYDYDVFVSKDANGIKVDASIGAVGTVVCVSERDRTTGTEFDYFDNEPLVLILKVEREYMKISDYTLTVQRTNAVPVATDMATTVEPPIGAFFIDRGVLPVLTVRANLPIINGVPTGELSYQWYINNENNTRGGVPLGEATGASYTMKPGETSVERTVYYYAEVTNTIDGKTSVTASPPRSVTFINKSILDNKSLAMIDIPAGTVTNSDSFSNIDGFGIEKPWSTTGFSMGPYLVTWELWKTVADYADAEAYTFSRIGNQGGAVIGLGESSTNKTAREIGNRLNPVTNISWRDAVVWCNAYSEMDGKQPVYRDEKGQPLRDSRVDIDILIDPSKMAGNKGYRLPTAEEWYYAARGAKPNAPEWNYFYPGTNTRDPQYLWSYSPFVYATEGILQTGEVGSLKPNSIGLYDMFCMVWQWVWWTDIYDRNAREQWMGYTWSLGYDFYFAFYRTIYGIGYDCYSWHEPNAAFTANEDRSIPFGFNGFRLARDKE